MGIFSLGRAVWVRFGPRWLPGTVTENDGRSISVRVGALTCFVHASAARRDLRVSKPRGA